MSGAHKLKKTPLHDLHIRLGARMVPFAGHDMPVQYREGIVREHLHTRAAAGLFDVSHMGQAWLIGPDFETTARALEALAPADFLGLAPGRIRYSQLLNPQGGIIDDFMTTRPADEALDGRLMLVVNAARKDVDYAWLRENLPDNVTLETEEDRALIALQGPKAEAVLARHCPDAPGLSFMQAAAGEIGGIAARFSRSGYTGEDGFEISVAASDAEALAELLLNEPEVAPIGLGARDTLRLEAGLCLYGHDIDETTSPVEAALVWSIGKRRREQGGFIGAQRVLKELAEGTARKRTGIAPLGRAPAREGTEVLSESGEEIGRITSGGFGPTVGGPVAMGYVKTPFNRKDTPLTLRVRGKDMPARAASAVFVPHNYKR